MIRVVERLERRLKRLNIDPAYFLNVLACFDAGAQLGAPFGVVGISIPAGTKVVGVHLDVAYQVFFAVLSNPDWPEVESGAPIPHLEADWRGYSFRLADREERK